MPEIVKMHVRQVRLRPYPEPERVKPASAWRPPAGRGRKHQPPRPFQPVEHAPGRAGQPYRPGSGLAVAEEQVPLTAVGLTERHDLVLAAFDQ